MPTALFFITCQVVYLTNRFKAIGNNHLVHQQIVIAVDGREEQAIEGNVGIAYLGVGSRRVDVLQIAGAPHGRNVGSLPQQQVDNPILPGAPGGI